MTARRPRRVWRLAVFAVLGVVVTACGPRFVDHSDHRYDPGTPVHHAGPVPTHGAP